MHSAFAQGEAVTPDSVRNFAESTFNSDVFKGFVKSYRQQNVGVVNSIDAAAVAQAKSALPKATEVGTQLKYGTHNVVSSDGETYVTWMIEAASAKPAERQALLGKLTDLAARRSPEAMTFQGFIAEYGLFGAPRNVARALDWYRAAAAMNYQPALYNLALAAAYGKGQAADLNTAGALVAQARPRRLIGCAASVPSSPTGEAIARRLHSMRRAAGRISRDCRKRSMTTGSR
jgi:TPR repeat protein